MHPVFHLFSISILFMFTNISLAATDDAVHALLKDIDFNAYPSGLGFTDAPKPTIDIDNDNILSIRIPVTPARNRMIKNSETMGGMTNGFSLVGGNAFDNTWSVGADDLVGLSIGAKLDQSATYSDARDMIHLNGNGSLFFDATLMKEKSKVFEVLMQTLIGIDNKPNQDFDSLNARGVGILRITVMGKDVYSKMDNHIVNKNIFKFEALKPITKTLFTSPSYKFMAGPVPMSVSGSLEGSMGIDDTSAFYTPDKAALTMAGRAFGNLIARGRLYPGTQEVQQWGQALGQVIGGASGYIDLNLTLLNVVTPFNFTSMPKDKDLMAFNFSGAASLSELIALDGKITAHYEMDVFKEILSSTVRKFCNALGIGCKNIEERVAKMEKMGRTKRDWLIHDFPGSSWGTHKSLISGAREVKVR